MSDRYRSKGKFAAHLFFGSVLGLSIGCQTWQSSVVPSSLAMKQGESRILKQAKNDPFPSPKDVGMISGEEE